MDAEMMDVGRTITDIAAERGAERPTDPAPSRYAPYEERAEWSERYVAWFITQSPQQGADPGDVRPTHRFETEYNSCVIDPPRYERLTSEELALFKRRQH